MKKRTVYLLVGFCLLVLVVAVVVHSKTGAPGLRTSPNGPNANLPGSANTLDPVDTFNKSQHSTTDPASVWVVVNKKHPLEPKAYAPQDLVAVGNGQFLRSEAAAALKKLLADAAAAGMTLTADSGYRSFDTQVKVYNSEVKANGQTVADTQSARPGYSEHQTGWAIDIGTSGCHIADCFGNTTPGKWVAASAHKYGFLLRYQPSTVDTTGYRAESWHFRYVGTTLSTELHNRGVKTLEEFFGISGGGY
jgi:D-alanyl-D-alanine carboxypeptidase